MSRTNTVSSAGQNLGYVPELKLAVDEEPKPPPSFLFAVEGWDGLRVYKEASLDSAVKQGDLKLLRYKLVGESEIVGLSYGVLHK